MHPLLSVKNRLRYLRLKHFERTNAGRRIKKLKGIHQGGRCFLIGNGPSLSVSDLEKLHANGDICFGFNRIYNIFDSTLWRPDYYLSQDHKMLAGCVEEVKAMPLPVKFVPVDLPWEHGLELEPTHPFKMLWMPKEDLSPSGFSTNAAEGVYWGSTCLYTAAQIAVYMGFSEIYLLGVDHRFQISQNNRGEIVVDNSVKDYFCDKYNEDKEKLYIPNTETSTLAYIAMKKGCEENGVRVYNATRGGMLEVFPRVDFDSLF
ncbi:MAG: DUF115 domain-containing protein [Clostridia bacterium]|nr:DUF115 domain-containing protein [Clostridia bacterium]